jgi:hypothetical protein
MSTIEELLKRNSSGSSLENRYYGRRGSSALTTRQYSLRKKLALTSPTSGGHPVDIVRPRTQVTEFFLSELVQSPTMASFNGLECSVGWTSVTSTERNYIVKANRNKTKHEEIQRILSSELYRLIVRRCITADRTLHNHRCEKFKSYMKSFNFCDFTPSFILCSSTVHCWTLIAF